MKIYVGTDLIGAHIGPSQTITTDQKMPVMNNDDEPDEKAARALKRQMDLALRFSTPTVDDFGNQRTAVNKNKQAKRLKKMQRRLRKAS